MKSASLVLAIIAIASTTFAEGPLEFKPADTVRTVLERQVGQRVEFRLKSGEKLVGKVEHVGAGTVHLSAITGMEFYDAVVLIDDVSAVLIKTK